MGGGDAARISCHIPRAKMADAHRPDLRAQDGPRQLGTGTPRLQGLPRSSKQPNSGDTLFQASPGGQHLGDRPPPHPAHSSVSVPRELGKLRPLASWFLGTASSGTADTSWRSSSGDTDLRHEAPPSSRMMGVPSTKGPPWAGQDPHRCPEMGA